MTERLMKSPKGVQNLIKAVLDIGAANSAKNQQKNLCDAKKVQIITAIVSNPTTSGGGYIVELFDKGRKIWTT